MDKYDREEIGVSDNNVIPGYLFDKAIRKFLPRSDGMNFGVKELPTRYEIRIDRKNILRNLSQRESKSDWMQDFINENPLEAILVKGIKVVERCGLDIPLHETKGTVTSVLYKKYICLLVTFKNELEDEWVDDLKAYFLKVLNESNECFIPKQILKNGLKAFIYQSTNDSDKKEVTPSKHSFEEFCRILKSSLVSTSIPMSAFVVGPSPVKSNVRRLEEMAHLKTTVTMHHLNSSIELTNDIGGRYISTYQVGIKDNTADVHKTRVSEPPNAEYPESYVLDESVGTQGNIMQPTNDQWRHSQYGETEVTMPIAPDPSHNHIGFSVAMMDGSQTKCRVIRSSLSVVPGEDIQQKSPTHHEKNFEFDSFDQKIPHQNIIAPAVQRTVPEEKEDEMKESVKHVAGKVCIQSQENTCNRSEERIIGQLVQDPLQNYVVADPITQKQVVERNSLQGTADKRQTSSDCSSKKRYDLNRNSGGSPPKKKSGKSQLQWQHSSESVVDQEKEDLHSTKQKQYQEKVQQTSLKSTYLSPTRSVRDPCGIEHKFYGIQKENVSEKCLILLGASGSGKTMLVNFIANFYMGNKSADDRLIYVETATQTSSITAYTFYSNENETALTVIDTPGLNDSSGAEVRDHVHTLKTFIANASTKSFGIHAIGFVAQAHLVRLTSSERLVMDYVSTLFGQSVSEHLLTFVTFADNQDTPPVIEAMKNYGVEFKLFMKFNNSALSNSNADEIDDLDRAYWRVCWKNWKKCLKTLKDLPTLSVHTMKAVQNEVYAKTVTESAEKDLSGELSAFMNSCKKANGFSEEASQMCEGIWELAAVIRQTNKQVTGAISCDDILINFATDICKKLGVSPHRYVSLLSLAPTGRLVVSGSEIIRTLKPVYLSAKNTPSSEIICRSITELSFCKHCRKEHRMEKVKSEGWKMPFKSSSSQLLCLKCKSCSCNADEHEEIKKQLPSQVDFLLNHAKASIQETLKKYSLPGYTVSEETFLRHLDKLLEFEHSQFIKDISRASNGKNIS